MRYTVGNKIKYFRELRGLSQIELGTRLGISNSRISNWEQGLNRPDVDSLILICQVLEISADELLDIDNTNMRLTADERQIISQYRNKPNLHEAIKILLGLSAQELAKIEGTPFEFHHDEMSDDFKEEMSDDYKMFLEETDALWRMDSTDMTMETLERWFKEDQVPDRKSTRLNSSH